MLDWIWRTLFGADPNDPRNRLRSRRTRRGNWRRPRRTAQQAAPERVSLVAPTQRVPLTWLQAPTIAPSRETWQEVVGELSYRSALSDVVEAIAPAGGQSSRVLVTAQLARASNPHDRSAVRVMIDGETVGYIPRGETSLFHPVLRELERAALPASCRALISGGDGLFGVWLSIAFPARRATTPPPTFAGTDCRVSVVGEEKHQEHLEELLASGQLRSSELAETADGEVAVSVGGGLVAELSADSAGVVSVTIGGGMWDA